MATQYTPILQLALPVTGELNGTWGDVVNDNITSMVEQAIAGLATINTWTANSHTLTTANGTTDEARCAMLVAADGAGGTALTGAGQIICPALTKLYVVQNTSATYAVTLKTAAGTGVSVAAGETAFLFCNGTNVNACVTQIVNGHVTGNLTVDGNATVNGNTTLGNATSDTVTITARVASDLNPSADNTYDLGTAGNSWRNLYIDGTATIATLNVTTIDTTNLEVTNIKAKDGTAAITLADATGVATLAANPILNAGTANGVVYANGSKVLTTGSALTFDGANKLSIIGSGNAESVIDASAAGSAVLTLLSTSGGNGLIGYGTTGGLRFGSVSGTGGAGFSEQMRLTSTGLGIGTSTIDTKLDVASSFGSNPASGGATLRLTSTATSGVGVGPSLVFRGNTGNTTATYGFAGLQGVKDSATADNYGGALLFLTQNSAGSTLLTERMRLDSSGNLGLGVTPSAWGSNYVALQASAYSTNLSSFKGGSGVTALTHNAYNNNTNWIYQNPFAAAKYEINGSGTHAWFTAPSGTAGNAISFTQAMTLDASGNLGIGTTTITDKLTVAGNINTYASASYIYCNGGSGSSVNSGFFLDGSGNTLRAYTGNTERMRIDSSGNVGVGTSSPVGRLTIQGAAGTNGINQGIGLLYSNGTQYGALGLNNGSGWPQLMARAAAGITFHVNSDLLTTGEAMRIDSSGNVGIGTSSPSYKLDVAGTIYTSTNYFAANNANLAWGTGSTRLAGDSSANTMVFLTNNTERMRIDSSGNLLVGTTSNPVGARQVVQSANDSYGFGVNGIRTGATSYLIYFRSNTTDVGTITSNGSTTSYNTTSDYRLKENIQPMQNALEFCRKQRPVDYIWKADGSKGSGYIAHWMQEDGAGQCVTGEKDAADKDGNPIYQGIDTSFMVGPLNAGLNELADIVDKQAKLIENQNQLIEALTARVAQLEGN